jgi:hypothetical protein
LEPGKRRLPMPTLRLKARRTAPAHDFDRIRDLSLTLAREPEQLLPTISFLKRSFPERSVLLELVLEVRRQALSVHELACQGSVQRASLMAEVDQLLAALDQLKQAAAELRESAQALEAVVTFGKAIQLQGKIAVMECLAKMLLFELE